MAYASWEYYQNEYKGRGIQDEAEFLRLESRAREEIDYYTLSRASPDDAHVRSATCAVADILREFEEAGNIRSEKVDEYSVTYNAPARAVRVERALYTHLGHTGLLYAGASLI